MWNVIRSNSSSCNFNSVLCQLCHILMKILCFNRNFMNLFFECRWRLIKWIQVLWFWSEAFSFSVIVWHSCEISFNRLPNPYDFKLHFDNLILCTIMMLKILNNNNTLLYLHLLIILIFIWKIYMLAVSWKYCLKLISRFKN